MDLPIRCMIHVLKWVKLLQWNHLFLWAGILVSSPHKLADIFKSLCQVFGSYIIIC